MDDQQSVTPHQTFELGPFEFSDGTVLPNAQIAYTTYGELSEGRDNVIVFPTFFTSTHSAHEWLVGPGEPLDTDRYFVVIPSLFGNGLSSSPSNTPAPFDRGRFPRVDMRDNVRAQQRLLTERFGVRKIELVIGGSMGALATFQWALSAPDLVQRIMPMCGAAKTSEHTYAFTWGVRAALEADAAWAAGDYDAPPLVGLKALGRVYAGWGVSQAFYRERRYREMEHETVDGFISDFWEAFFASLDANNLISQLKTWQSADLSRTPGYDGDLGRALGRIRAKAFLVPAQKDLYFPPEDSVWEAEQMANAEVRVIPGVWGHVSGMGIDPACSDFIRQTARELLAR
ncbi:alpha/beta fold hydrolase [Streptomyces sp. CA-106131]|uniref:alpha/beta fold hydrolase n=1 Tax=Streptomyces sp. CA-106131 TaxID=3240045 RepID=UPI003D8E1DF9